MNLMLIIGTLIAVAVATPAHSDLVAPGSKPIIEIGEPTTVDFTPVAVEPAIVDNMDPTKHIVNVIKVTISGTSGTVNVNVNTPTGHVKIVDGVGNEIVPIAVETPILPEAVVPGPVNIVDGADNVIVPTPVNVGTPIVPAPTVVLSEPLN